MQEEYVREILNDRGVGSNEFEDYDLFYFFKYTFEFISLFETQLLITSLIIVFLLQVRKWLTRRKNIFNTFLKFLNKLNL